MSQKVKFRLKIIWYLVVVLSFAMGVSAYQNLAFLDFLFFGIGWILNGIMALLVIYLIGGFDNE